MGGRAGDIDEGGSPAVQFESICPNLCLYQTSTTKAAGGMGSFSKGFYMRGEANADLATPLVTKGGTASMVTDVPYAGTPWSIKYVASGKRIQQFFGNYVPVRCGQVIKMSMWMKCVVKDVLSVDLEPAPSAARPSAPSSGGGGVLAGKRIRVVGTSKAELNDSAGVALKWDAQRQRYTVKLKDGRQVALKEQNVVAL